MPSTPQSTRKHRSGLSRIAAACERCRKRKQKCDAKRPSCGPCSAISAECVMSDRLVVYSNPNCNCDELRSRVEELQAQIRSLNAELSTERSRHSDQSLQLLNDTTLISNNTPPEAPPQIHHNPQQNAIATNGGLEYRLLRPTFGDGDHRRGFDIDRLGLAWRLWHNDQSTETPLQNASSINNVPISQYGTELVDVFFDNCWAHLPVLHKPTFLQHHYEHVVYGNGTNHLSMFHVYMVFAIAAGARSTTKTGYRFPHRDFFNKAIQNLPHIQSVNDFDYLQCLLLMCMYGRNEPQSVNMWHTTGLALRTAISLNLHHQESIASENIYETEMAKRLFWSAYVMDRSMAIAMGRPLGIQDSDITTSLPEPLCDDQLTLPADKRQNLVPQANDMSTFVHVIKLRRLNADIYQTFHSVGSVKLNDDQLDTLRQQYGQQMNQWLITAPRYILTTSMQQSTEWFQIAYHHAILSLNRPSYAAPIPTVASLRLCADAAISLISCYGSLYAKNRVSYSFIALNSIFMAAITMLYTLRASSAVRQELSKAVTQTNINTCLSLFRGISGGRQIAERCSQIVSRLGQATVALFDRENLLTDHVDTEFMSWFGLKATTYHDHNHNPSAIENLQSTPGDEHVSGHNQGGASTPTAQTSAQQINSWQQAAQDPAGNDTTDILADPPTSMSIESAWQEFFAPFDVEGSSNLDFFPMEMF